MTRPAHDRTIARLPDDERRRLLEWIARDYGDHELIQVEHHWNRRLPDANKIVGEPLGVASTTGGGTADPFIIREAETGELWSISAAHVLRIRRVDPASWEVVEVLAGPAITDENR